MLAECGEPVSLYDVAARSIGDNPQAREQYDLWQDVWHHGAWAPEFGGRIVLRPRKRVSSYFLLKWGVQIPYLFHENQTPRSDSANFVPLEPIFCPQILEPSTEPSHWNITRGTIVNKDFHVPSPPVGYFTTIIYTEFVRAALCVRLKRVCLPPSVIQIDNRSSPRNSRVPYL